MRDDELRQWLRTRNPWWRVRGDLLAWTRADNTLVGAAALDIDYDPPVLADVTDGGLYVMRGPRRVGKSVVLKRFVVELLTRRAVAPSRIIYLSLDEFDARTLRRALDLGRQLTLSAGDEPRYWLIDEVTATPGWTAVLKSARDDTPLAHDTVVLTGSSAHGLDEARRTLGAGRVGNVVNPFRLLLPMRFRDFCQLRGLDLPELPEFGPVFTQSDDLRRALGEIDPFIDEMDLAWQAYCEVGGFPRAVAEHIRHGQVSPAFVRDLQDWLAPDVVPGDPPQSIATLLAVVAERMAAPLNIRGTAASLGMTRERLDVRLNRLRSTFAALICPQVNDHGEPVPGAQAKFYLLDPLLAQLPTLIDETLPPPAMSVVSEATFGSALAAAVERLHPGRLIEGRAIGYLRRGGKEIDFAPLPVTVGSARLTTPPAQSTWVSDGWRPAARTIEQHFGAGFIATKSVLDLTHPAWAVPVGVLALLL